MNLNEFALHIDAKQAWWQSSTKTLGFALHVFCFHVFQSPIVVAFIVVYKEFFLHYKIIIF